jgi:hypothetical protein
LLVISSTSIFKHIQTANTGSIRAEAKTTKLTICFANYCAGGALRDFATISNELFDSSSGVISVEHQISPLFD